MLFLTYAHTVDCDGHFTSPVGLYVNPDLGISEAISEGILTAIACKHGDYADQIYRGDENRIRHLATDPDDEERLFAAVYVIDSYEHANMAIRGELQQRLYLRPVGFHITGEGRIHPTDMERYPRQDVPDLATAITILRVRGDNP